MGRAKVRLFVGGDLAPRQEVAVSANQAHYLAHVMRLGAGDGVRLFNGRDGEWTGEIVSVGKASCQLRVDAPLRPQRVERGPWLVFGPLKKDAIDMVVAKATELGAERLLPVITRFTTVERVNLERLRAQAIEAAEQCGRMSVPDVAAPMLLDRLIGAWLRGRALLFLDERGGGQPIAEAVTVGLARAGDPAGAPGILVGPEGGFTGDEAEALARLPFVVRVDMGPRILRAETAALAALACWQAFAGDWRPAE